MPRKPISADEAARRALEHDWAKRLDTFGKLATTDPDKLSNDDVHDLRSIGEALGERRMWDIALGDAEHYGADTSEIEKERRRAHATMRRALRHARVHKLVTSLHKLEREIPGLMLEKLLPWLRDYEWELAYRLGQPPKAPTERHELRIQAKKARYVLECLGRRAPSIEKLQDHLGREHDLHVLQQLIGRKRALIRDTRIARN